MAFLTGAANTKAYNNQENRNCTSAFQKELFYHKK